MENEYNYSHILSNEYLMIPQGISAALTPFFGILVDKIGYRCHLLIFSAMLPIYGHTVFLLKCIYTFDESSSDILMITDVIYGLIALGISFSIFPSIVFTAVNIALPHKLKGFGMGLMSAVLALGLAIYPIIVGTLTEKRSGEENINYMYVQIFFVITSCLSLMTAVVLLWADHKFGENQLSNLILYNVCPPYFQYSSIAIETYLLF